VPHYSDLKSELSSVATSLRPLGKPFVSILELANNLGTAVSLRLQNARSSNTAQIDLWRNPAKIVVHRFSRVEGERELRRHDEGLLNARERFSVAHELGHWVLFNRFRVQPETEKRLYWEQEEVINAFAGQLLVPDWLARNWLDSTQANAPVPPFALRSWAEQCCVSEEVVTKALVRQKNLIGFLRLVPTHRKRDKTPVLQVLSCAKGDALELPAERSHIANSRLFGMLTNNAVGSGWLRQVTLARCAPQDLGIAWRSASRRNTENTIWLSLILGRNTEPDHYTGSLFGQPNKESSPLS
jgi:hypothetical protein